MNTLFVVTRGATVRRDHLTLKVIVEKVTRLTVPIHHKCPVVSGAGLARNRSSRPTGMVDRSFGVAVRR